MRLFYFLLLFSTVLSTFVVGPNDEGGNWPIEVSLGTAVRPSGVVAARGTSLFVSTVGGQLWKVDVKAGTAVMINAGGDGQALAGLCADERGEGTLYAGGRESGKLFAFNYAGKLVRIYNLTNPSTPQEPHFIADCIHSRYRLMITDSYQPGYIYFQVPDKGPTAGMPAPINDHFDLHGFLVPFKQWPKSPLPPPSRRQASGDGIVQPPKPRLGAYGIEWTGFYNETAYVMHSALGQLYAFSVTTLTSTGAVMTRVDVEGRRRTFPGALGILFDSMNERIMYVCMPGANVIAVLEFHNEDRYRAKFIRFIKGDLMNGPVMLGEYGQFIYPVSGMFTLSPEKREEATYTLTKLSRHRQAIPPNSTLGEPFTVIYDSQPASYPPRSLSARAVENDIFVPPRKTGIKAVLPDEIRQIPTANATVSPSPSPTPLPDMGFLGISDAPRNAKKTQKCFPAAAIVNLVDGTTRAMRYLNIGDVVQVDAHKYSTVYAFSHSDPQIVSEFIELSLRDGRQLRLTSGHLTYAADGSLVPASSLCSGTRLFDGSIITRTTRVLDRGLYNPQTLDGAIVVDGVRVSTYTNAVAPAAAHALLAPMRASRPLATLVSALLAHGTW